jgi:hypothetical protein
MLFSTNNAAKSALSATASSTTPTTTASSTITTTTTPPPEGDRRIVCPYVLDVIHSKLKPNGVLHIATDVDVYALHIDTLLASRSDYKGGIVATPEWRKKAPTRYEIRAVTELNHAIRDFQYAKI